MSNPSTSSRTPLGAPARRPEQQTVQHPLLQAPKPIHFATFYASNTAAIHLLESIKAQTARGSCCFISSATSIGYRLELAVPTEDSSSRPGTWKIGCGWNRPTIHNINDKGVDILLCPPRGLGALKARQSIASYHAELSFHPESGALLLFNFHYLPIIYKDTAGNDIAIKGLKPCVLLGTTNQLTFGEYQFSLQFLKLGSVAQDELRSLLKDFILVSGGHPPVPSFNPIPNGPPIMLGSVWKRVDMSGRGSWLAGISTQDGRPVLVRTISQREQAKIPRQQISMQRELARINTLSGFEGLAPILDTWCEHNQSPPCKTHSDDSETIYRSWPLYAYQFEDMPWEKLDPSNCLRYCFETLVGLDRMHAAGYVHGGINPRTLLLLPDAAARTRVHSSQATDSWMLPMKAAILGWDVGPSRRTRKLTMWHAPEIQKSLSTSAFTKAADVWSLGVSWMYAFHSRVKLGGITEPRGLQILADREPTLKQIDSVFYPRQLLLSMLAIEPHDRPDVHKLLDAPFWDAVKGDIEDLEGTRKRVHFHTPPEDDGCKRTRLHDSVLREESSLSILDTLS